MAAIRSASPSGTPREVKASRRSSNPVRSRPVSSLGRPAADGQHAVGEEVDRRLDVERRAAVVQQPPRRPLGQLAALQQQQDLHRGVHLAVQRLDLRPEPGQVEDVPGHQPGRGDVRDRRAGLLVEPERERDPGPVHHVVDHRRGDDLPVQPVSAHPAGVALPQRRREVVGQHPAQVRVVGQAGRQHLLRRGDLGVREQHGELRHGQPGARGPALGDLLVARQHVEPPAGSAPRAPACGCTGRARAASAAPGPGTRPGPGSARSCARAPGRRPRRSSRAAARPGRPGVSSPSRTTPSSRILMLTSWSEVSTPAELSMKSVLTSPPPSAYSIRASCGQAEVPALADDPGPQLGRRRPGPRRWTGPPRRRATCAVALT